MDFEMCREFYSRFNKRAVTADYWRKLWACQERLGLYSISQLQLHLESTFMTTVCFRGVFNDAWLTPPHCHWKSISPLIGIVSGPCVDLHFDPLVSRKITQRCIIFLPSFLPFIYILLILGRLEGANTRWRTTWTGHQHIAGLTIHSIPFRVSE